MPANDVYLGLFISFRTESTYRNSRGKLYITVFYLLRNYQVIPGRFLQAGYMHNIGEVQHLG